MASSLGRFNDDARGLDLLLPGGDFFEQVGALPIERVRAIKTYFSSARDNAIMHLQVVGDLLANVDLAGPDKETFRNVGYLVRELADSAELAGNLVVAAEEAQDPEARKFRKWGDPPGGRPKTSE